MWEHDKIIQQLKQALGEKAKIRENIKHYKPDIFYMLDGSRVVVEIETYANPSKITQDIVFSHMIGANKLVLIFSNKHKRGAKRIETAYSILHMLRRCFPELCRLEVKAFWADDCEDITKLCLPLFVS